MAFEKSNGTTVPHATDYADLLDIMVAFAVGTGDWEIVADNLTASNYIILKGLDYSGDKAIYVAIKRYAAPISDVYGWIFQGYTGYTGVGFYSEPGAIIGELPAMPLWNDEIPYWLSVNPRRILLVAKVAGVYVSCYLGLMLPYGSTGQWQYPLVIGGSNVTNTNGTVVTRYSDTSAAMCVPYIPSGSDSTSNLVVRSSSGQWIRIFNGAKSIVPPTANFGVLTAHGVSPYCDRFGENTGYGWQQLRPNLDGKYDLRTLRIMRGDTPDAYGYLDGVKFVPGYLLSAEDTMAVGGDDYTVFQDTFRTGLPNFFAVKES